MSYHLKYLKYKKKYLNLKAELEGGMMQPSAEDAVRLEEGETNCLFNQDMTEENFMEILKDIADCNDEEILQDNSFDKQNLYDELENRIESYFNFIKAREYIDVPEHARPHLLLIANNLPYRYAGVHSVVASTIATASRDGEAVYNYIIKTRINFLKSYGKLAFIKDLKDKLYDSHVETETQKATIEQLTTDLQTQQDYFKRLLESDRVKIEDQNDKIKKLSEAQSTLEQLLFSMDKTIKSQEFMNMQLELENKKLKEDKLKLEISKLEIKDDKGKLQDSIIELQEKNEELKKDLLEAENANKELEKTIQKLNEKIVKMDKEKTKEIAKLTMEYIIARKKADMEIDDLKNQKNEKNEEINDLKDQVKSKDNTILKIRTKVNNNLSKLIQNMIDTIEPKTYKQPPLFMI